MADTMEQILVRKLGPHMMTSKINQLLNVEVTKGCTAQIYNEFVCMEPSFNVLEQLLGQLDSERTLETIFEMPPPLEDLVRFEIYISPQQKFDWLVTELFIKQLSAVNYRMSFEIIGNSSSIRLVLMCHLSDRILVQSSFRSLFPNCEIAERKIDMWSNWFPESVDSILLKEYYPSPPYHHLLTCCDQLYFPVYDSVLVNIAEFQPPAVAIIQIVFQPVHPNHPWNENVKKLVNLEYSQSTLQDIQQPRNAQQQPSSSLTEMAKDSGSKAHDDKPFFSVVPRVILLNAEEEVASLLPSITAFTRRFQYGGRPLNEISEVEFLKVHSPQEIQEMIVRGSAYRPGFLVNTLELSGLVHLPPGDIFESTQLPITPLEQLVPLKGQLTEGICIGTYSYADKEVAVRIPSQDRTLHLFQIGMHGMGKTSVFGHAILQDTDNGDGLVLLDPHGDLTEHLLGLIPEKDADRVIYFDPGDKEWVPLWNPLAREEKQDIGMLTNDLVKAFKNLFDSGWGHRLEHLLRHAIYSLLHLPNATLQDINILFMKGAESKALKNKILSVIQNKQVKRFWLNDFPEYKPPDLNPAKHKLSQLITFGSIEAMLSQPENRFHFRELMDESKILLINLSKLDVDSQMVVGSFLLAFFYQACLSRRDIVDPKQRKTFHIYCDEAHRFIRSDAIESIISEGRKFGVSFNLASQRLSQFDSREKIDALCSVGTTVIFRVDSNDAAHLKANMQNKIGVNDITSLEKHEAIVRSDTDIVRMKTLPPKPIPKTNCRERIIEASRQQYCKHISHFTDYSSEHFTEAPARRMSEALPTRIKKTDQDFYYEEL